MFLTTNGRERTRMTALHSSPLSVRGSKHWTGEPVENVMATRMTFRQERMLKIVAGRMRYPNAFHYFSRALIAITSTAHRPNPFLAKFSLIRSANASLSARSSSLGIYCMTRGSELSAAKAGKSSSRQSRSRRRLVISSIRR